MALSSVTLDRIKLNIAMARKDYALWELANAAGVAVSTVSDVRNGKRCSRQTAEALAAALEVQVSDLCASSGKDSM